MMAFEWDAAKNQANIRKHGVSFETAQRIFEGPILTWFDDRIRLISARPASRKER